MAMTSGFFPDNNGDRSYTADFWAKMIGSLISNGVGIETFTVKPGNGMQVAVSPGTVWINGYFGRNPNDYTLSVQNAHGTLDRIDAVVLRLSLGDRSIDPLVITGMPSNAPTASALVRNSDTYDLKLAEITVRAGATKITQAQVKDTRADSGACGWTAGIINQITTTELFSQYNALFDVFMASIKGKLGDDPATSLQNQVNSLSDEIAAVEEAANDTRIDLEDFKSAQTPVFGTLTPMSGFRFLTSTNAPVVYRIGRLVHLQFAAQQAGLSNRSIVRLPKGMHDSKNHLIMGMGTETGQLYPLFVGKDVVSFNSNTQTDVYVNASFVLEG